MCHKALLAAERRLPRLLKYELFVQKMTVRCLGIFFLVARDLYESDKEQK